MAALGCLFIIIDRITFLKRYQQHSHKHHQKTLLTLAYAAQPKLTHQSFRNYCRNQWNYDPKPNKVNWKTGCKCKRLPPFPTNQVPEIESFITHPLARPHEQDYSMRRIPDQTQEQLNQLKKWYQQNSVLYNSPYNQPTNCKDYPSGSNPEASEFSIYKDYSHLDPNCSASAPPRYEESEFTEKNAFLA